jgi:hypothetical protein
MLKFLKYAGSLFVALILLFLFVANFSAVETRYECKGELKSAGKATPKTLFIKLETYRWWVGLWSDSNASLAIECPNEWVDYFGDVKKVGDQLQLFDSKKVLVGNFSTLSKTLALKTSAGFFDGTCTAITK